MRLIFVLLIIASAPTICWPQKMYASYSASKTIDLNSGDDYVVYFNYNYSYQVVFNDKLVWSSAVLEQLKTYPNGKVTITTKDPNYKIVTDLCRKPLQFMEAVYFDSTISKRISDPILTALNDTCAGEKALWKFQPGFQPWKFLEERRAINGLQCQRAQLFLSDGNLYWDLWFAPEIEIVGAPFSLYNLPGLMVEGINYGTGLNFKLLTLENLESNDPRLQLPSCFNEEFKYRGIMKPWTVENKN